MLTREWIEQGGRRQGELERAYWSVFEQFERMVVDGVFPFPQRSGDSSAAPRVGDGVMLLDEQAEVRYVSPNANSALHRVGIQATAIGMRLSELGFHDGPVRQAFERGEPVIEEFEQAPQVTLLCRCRALPRATARSPAPCCSFATSPNCASATGCSSARTRPSARSTTG